VAVGRADIAELYNTATLSIHTCRVVNQEYACISAFHVIVNTTLTTFNNSRNTTTNNTTMLLQQRWQHQRQEKQIVTLTLSWDDEALGTTDSV
jgi:hypothetical protein